MSLPVYITAYLDEQGIPEDAYADLLTSFADLRLDALARVEIAMLIEEHTGCLEIKDEVYEKWETLADVAEAAMWFEGVVV